MGRLDDNLDAYRMAARILHSLRTIVRAALSEEHGQDWPTSAKPDETMLYLVQRQAREASINWHLADTVDILEFAGFADLHEMISASPSLAKRFAPLAGDPTVLRIRFLELDSILNRLAYMRPIMDTDLSFLASFGDRFQKLVVDRPAVGPVGEPGADTATLVPEPVAAKAQAPKAHTPPPESAKAKGSLPETEEAPPTREPEPHSGTGRKGANAPSAELPSAAPAERAAKPATDLAASIEAGDNRAIVTSLRDEVTPIADGLWNSTVANPHPKVWETVRESNWYRDRFSPLGLRPVSDFYELFDSAKEKIIAGASRTDIQEFLKDRGFAQTLLALRSLFNKVLT